MRLTSSRPTAKKIKYTEYGNTIVEELEHIGGGSTSLVYRNKPCKGGKRKIFKECAPIIDGEFLFVRNEDEQLVLTPDAESSPYIKLIESIIRTNFTNEKIYISKLNEVFGKLNKNMFIIPTDFKMLSGNWKVYDDFAGVVLSDKLSVIKSDCQGNFSECLKQMLREIQKIFYQLDIYHNNEYTQLLCLDVKSDNFFCINGDNGDAFVRCIDFGSTRDVYEIIEEISARDIPMDEVICRNFATTAFYYSKKRIKQIVNYARSCKFDSAICEILLKQLDLIACWRILINEICGEDPDFKNILMSQNVTDVENKEEEKISLYFIDKLSTEKLTKDDSIFANYDVFKRLTDITQSIMMSVEGVIKQYDDLECCEERIANAVKDVYDYPWGLLDAYDIYMLLSEALSILDGHNIVDISMKQQKKMADRQNRAIAMHQIFSDGYKDQLLRSSGITTLKELVSFCRSSCLRKNERLPNCAEINGYFLTGRDIRVWNGSFDDCFYCAMSEIIVSRNSATREAATQAADLLYEKAKNAGEMFQAYIYSAITEELREMSAQAYDEMREYILNPNDE